MKPKDKYRMKKKIAAGIALLLAAVMAVWRPLDTAA